MVRKGLIFLWCLTAPLTASGAAVPVHVTLKAQAAVSADAGGYFSLASIAALSGGTAAERQRLGAVCVGRAPLPDEVRRLTPGDVTLKLRQAGFHPEEDAIIDGATQIAVTVCEIPAPPAPNNGEVGVPSSPPPPLLGAGGQSPVLIHRGDGVTIVVQDDAMSVTAKGVSRDEGRAGDTIHVHRDGVMTDLSVTVLDAQTVQLEP